MGQNDWAKQNDSERQMAKPGFGLLMNWHLCFYMQGQDKCISKHTVPAATSMGWSWPLRKLLADSGMHGMESSLVVFSLGYMMK